MHETGGEAELDERQERAVRMGQGPELAAQPVIGVEIKAGLEAVQGLQQPAGAQENQEPGPAQTVVALRQSPANRFQVVIRGLRHPDRSADVRDGSEWHGPAGRRW